MIRPTIGRVVWYRRPGGKPDDQPEAAMVTYVWGDRSVNLIVHDRNGQSRPATSVPLVQEGDEKPPTGIGYAEWMPYQISTAKAAEKQTAPA